jgi:hypothetical protein
MIDTKIIKKPRDCIFITLYDTSLFKDLKMNEGATNYVLWYKKSDPSQWGVTIKKFDDKDEQFISQHVWKLTWTYNEEENILIPTKSSMQFTEIMKGELAQNLCDIKAKYLVKKNKQDLKKKQDSHIIKPVAQPVVHHINPHADVYLHKEHVDIHLSEAKLDAHNNHK